MDRPSLYDEDILAWSEQQAASLRRMAGRQNVPNDLDLDNVVEEIESVGRAQLYATESFIELILVHVAKAVSDPGSPSIGHWRTECIGWHSQLNRSFSPSMRKRIDMDALWTSALRQADSALAEHGKVLGRTLLGSSLVTLDDLLSVGFEFRDLVDRICKPAA